MAKDCERGKLVALAHEVGLKFKHIGVHWFRGTRDSFEEYLLGLFDIKSLRMITTHTHAHVQTRSSHWLVRPVCDCSAIVKKQKKKQHDQRVFAGICKQR